MTARELIIEGNEGYKFKDVIDNLSEQDILDCMHEYAKIKCQELLEIVAEKSSTLSATIYISPGTPHTARLSKDKILNAVNLDDFII